MEGGILTLLVGVVLIVLFTDAAPKHMQNRAALHAIAIASGLGLLLSGYLREVALLMSLGLAFSAFGLSYLVSAGRRVPAK